jgi:hypothetical protein
MVLPAPGGPGKETISAKILGISSAIAEVGVFEDVVLLAVLRKDWVVENRS